MRVSTSSWWHMPHCLMVPILLAVPALAGAASITIVPTNQTVEVGTEVQVDIVAQDLPLGGFSFSLTFDQLVLGLPSVTFGSALGWPESIQSATLRFGAMDLAEVSLLPAPDLALLQEESYRLVSLRFTPQYTG